MDSSQNERSVGWNTPEFELLHQLLQQGQSNGDGEALSTNSNAVFTSQTVPSLPRSTGMGSSKRRSRTVFNVQTIEFLKSEYDVNAYPTYSQRCYFSKILKVPEDRIQVWFQNRRSRNKGNSTSANASSSSHESNREDRSKRRKRAPPKSVEEPINKRLHTDEPQKLTNEMCGLAIDNHEPSFHDSGVLSDINVTDVLPSQMSPTLSTATETSTTSQIRPARDDQVVSSWHTTEHPPAMSYMTNQHLSAHQPNSLAPSSVHGQTPCDAMFHYINSEPLQPTAQLTSSRAPLQPIQSANVFQFPSADDNQPPFHYASSNTRPSTQRHSSLDLGLNTPSYNSYSPLWNHIPFSPLYLNSPMWALAPMQAER